MDHREPQTGLAFEHYQGVDERTLPGLHQHLVSFLDAMKLDRANALDLGCGTGAWLKHLLDNGWTDLSGVDLDRPKTRTDGINIVQGDLNANLWYEQFAGRTYKLITCIEVIEHIENIGLFFDQVKRLLSADGLLLLTTPNIHSLSARIKFLYQGRLKLLDEKGDPTHVHPIYKVSLNRILDRRDLHISSESTFPEKASIVDTPPLSIGSRLAGLLFDDALPGDILVLTIQHKQSTDLKRIL